MVDSPSGGAPTKAPRWDLADTGVAAVEIVFRGALGWFRGTQIYIGERSRSVDARGAHETGGAPYRAGALLSRGSFGCFLTCTPSPLDHVCSKKIASEGFIPFGLHLVLLFFETLK